jgi:glycosyltransferase involved in cell wall biosynthesis
MTQPAYKVSVAIITRDEEAYIGDCLDSVRWADELVVVDTGSGDRTLEICRKYTPHVYSLPWEGYAVAKNAALDLTTSELILSLDADERVSPELRGELAELRQYPWEMLADGYAMPRRNYLWEQWLRYGGLYPDYQIRLLKRGKGRFKVRRVHESVNISGRVGHLQHPIDHHSYRNMGDVIARLNRYSDLAAQDQFDHGQRFRLSGLLLRPLGRFMRHYLLRQGFRDGIPGLIMAVSYAYSVFARETKLWEMTCLHPSGKQPGAIDPPSEMAGECDRSIAVE